MKIVLRLLLAYATMSGVSVFCLFIVLPMCGMEKQPQKSVRVSTMDQESSWNLDEAVVSQIGVLADQIKDGVVHPFLPATVNFKQFTDIFQQLAKSSKDRKAHFKMQMSKDLVEIAITSDCLDVPVVLKQTLSVLCKRPLADVFKEEGVKFPETLQRVLAVKAMEKNHYIKTVLLKASKSRSIASYSPLERLEVQEGAFVLKNTETKKCRAITCAPGVNNFFDGHAERIVRGVRLSTFKVHYDAPTNTALLFSNNGFNSYIVWCDLQKATFLQKWLKPCLLKSFEVHATGLVALVTYERHIFFAEIDSPEWEQVRRFETGNPIALSFNKTRTKCAVGSDEGQLAIFDFGEAAKESSLSKLKNGSDDSPICALAFNPKNDGQIAIASQSNWIRLCSLVTGKCEIVGGHRGTELIKFNNDARLLVSISPSRICIWSVPLMQKMHEIDFNSIEFNSFDDGLKSYMKLYVSCGYDDRVRELEENGYSAIKVLDEDTAKAIEYLPLPFLYCLIQIGSQLIIQDHIVLDHIDDFKKIYPLLPQSIKEVINKRVSWSDWLWLKTL